MQQPPTSNRPSPDIDKLAQLFQDRYGLVVGVARRFSPLPDLVYDIAQQAFLHFVKAAQSIEWSEESGVDALLYRITKNIAITCWRKEKAKSSEKMQRIREMFLARSREKEEDATDEKLSDEIPLLRECMEQLPKKSRDLLNMHYVEQVSMEAIGQQTRIKPSTIRQTISRIRRKLKDCIEKKQKK